ncbi:MAG TPA: acyl transferase, partial [Phaeodactylibacter sp.]|nr:acyl transferase [Phaeodactylibacter sp.]
MNRDQLLQEIRQVDSDNFVPVALEVFRYQAKYNLLYRRFLQLLAISPERVQHLEDIPFLPISLFKSHTVKTGDWKASLIFRSSGTTGTA